MENIPWSISETAHKVRRLVTFGYVDNRQVHEQDFGAEKTIFVIRDRYTGMIQTYPSARKDADAVIRGREAVHGSEKDSRGLL